MNLSGGLTAGAILTSAGCAFSARSVGDNKIRIGVVGGGFGSEFQWHRHPNCEVTGVTDLRRDRREWLRSVYGCDVAYDSLEEMVRRATDVDAVAVFSGAPDHVKHTRMCMERGWHVISAVPACMSLDEAHELKELTQSTGLTYMMAETSYYRPESILMREMYRKNLLGKLFYTECEYYHDRGDLEKLGKDKRSRHLDPDGSYSWRWGFPPMLYPTHALSYVTGITGEKIKSVSCLGWGTGDHPYLSKNVYGNPYWNQSALMQTDAGHMVRCNVFWLCAADGERAQWFGDKATFYMEKSGVHAAELKFRTRALTPPKGSLPEYDGKAVEIPAYWQSEMLPEEMRLSTSHGNSHPFLSAEFINALVAERPPAIDIDMALAMTVPGIVANHSALKEGERLSVPQI